MAITNQDKPSTSLTNSTKPFNGIAWDTWDVAWQDETRTWDELAEIMQNSSRPSFVEYISTESFDYLITEDDNFLITDQSNIITNISKP